MGILRDAYKLATKLDEDGYIEDCFGSILVGSFLVATLISGAVLKYDEYRKEQPSNWPGIMLLSPIGGMAGAEIAWAGMILIRDFPGVFTPLFIPATAWHRWRARNAAKPNSLEL